MITRQRSYRIIATIALFALLLLSTSLAIMPALNAHADADGTTNPNYQTYAASGAQVLQGWYNTSNGLFNTTGWWNSANALNALIDYARLTGNTAYTSDIATTFNLNSSSGFITNPQYYDDEGWWALTWVNAYDYTGNVTYLNMAKSIFTNITGAWDTTCNGGVWWSGARTYKNAITNELFLELAARLHERTPGDSGSGSYLDWANREWTWFSSSGLINSSNLINDGLNSSCQNNGETTWTYNQGVILGGLTDMYKITANTSYLNQAETIANAAISTLITANGVLKEPNEPCGTSCGGDGPQFKGVFMRNLASLYGADHQQIYENFILTNANSIWQNDRNSANQFGMMWYGSFDSADAARQSSALDALNAAIPFSNASTASNLSNVALNKTATADSSCSSAETPNKAVDGSTINDSKWCSGGTNGQYWLQVDLGASYNIASFTVMHAGAGGEETDRNTQAFSIQTSSDAATWATVVNVQNNTASVTTHQIALTTARYIKLVIAVPQTSTQYVAARIYEFQVYAFPFTAATPTPTPGTGSLQINAGGPAVAPFVADTDFTGGSTATSGNAITTSGVSNPAPTSVYQFNRYGNFTYTIPNLTPNTSYPVRLDFAETYWTTTGQRVFNVSANGQAALTNFDIVAAAGGNNKAVAEQFNVTASTSGTITLQFTTVVDNAQVNGIEVLGSTTPGAGSVQINAGGVAVAPFVADTNFTGGTTATSGNTITTSGVSNPAPTSVYQSNRYGNFTYTIPNLTPGATYTVRLHFAETYWTATGQRVFNVSANNQAVLTNFDIVAAAGGNNKAVAKQFNATASAGGAITLQFTTIVDNAQVNGIEILPA